MTIKFIDFETTKERDTLDLLELVCQLAGRMAIHPSKEMHESYWEARKELEDRINNSSLFLQ